MKVKGFTNFDITGVWPKVLLVFEDFDFKRSSVRLKPDFGIGNRNQDQVSVSVSGPELFLPKPKLSLKLKNSL